MLKKVIFPVLLAMIWISIHEFVRNQVVLTQHWTDHYASMGLVFPADPVNGAVWGVWGFAACRFHPDHHTEILIHGNSFPILAGRVYNDGWSSEIWGASVQICRWRYRGVCSKYSGQFGSHVKWQSFLNEVISYFQMQYLALLV